MQSYEASSLKGKVPPNNIEAERAVLGALMLDDDAAAIVKPLIDHTDFYSVQHQAIYRAIIDLYVSGNKFDIIVLTDYLRKNENLDSVGGASYIASLTDAVPSAANIDYYARIVLDASIRRNLLKVSHKIAADIFDDSVPSRTVLEEAQKQIFELTDAGNSATFKKIGDIIMPTLDHLQKIYSEGSDFTGIPSGFERLDTLTFGFQDSEFIIIGARPSVGKTAFAMRIASNIAVESNVPAAFFSLEMSAGQLIQRLIACEAKIDSKKMRSANLSLRDLQSIVETCGRLYEAPLYIVDMPNMKLLDLRAMARQLCTQQEVKIIFIDYLSLITSENHSIPRHEQIAEISRSLKSLARELNIPIVALAQLTREAEGKEPSLSDIRESGSLEQDADVVMFLHRDRKQTNEDPSKPIPTDLIIAKQRNGPTGKLHLDFIPMYATFVTAQNRPEN